MTHVFVEMLKNQSHVMSCVLMSGVSVTGLLAQKLTNPFQFHFEPTELLSCVHDSIPRVKNLKFRLHMIPLQGLYPAQ